MLNKIILQGRLTRDPELKQTENGIAVSTFCLAVEKDYKAKDGTKEAEFFDCVAWRNTAEFVSKYFSKGRMAIVEGKLQCRSYKDKDGNNRKVVDVLAENIYFGDAKKADSDTPVEATVSEEDLPF